MALEAPQGMTIESLLKNFPEVTSRGIFSLSVPNHKDILWQGKYLSLTLVAWDAICSPPDLDYQHILYVIFNPADATKSLINSFNFRMSDLTQDEAMKALMRDIDIKYEDAMTNGNL